MRGMNFNAGLRGVLFDARHFERMGAAIWLYGWLVLRQTHQSGDIGWVLGGAPINYREIEKETGFNRRTLERWMRTLRTHGYVLTQTTPSGIIIRITKAKKFPQDRELFHSRGRDLADKTAGPLRRRAEASTPSRVSDQVELFSNQSSAGGIGSSSVERKIETPVSFPAGKRQNEIPAGSGNSITSPRLLRPAEFLREAQLRVRLLRAEREEAVRRELLVGAGPEVRHS
jgi:hypothetical protein